MTHPSPEIAADTKLEELRTRLQEVEELLSAIRKEKEDALLDSSKIREQMHTESGVYRQLIETISEGAVTLSGDGIILYCNIRTTELLGLPLNDILGTSLRDYMPPDDQKALAAVLTKARKKPGREELNLQTSDGRLAPVYLSVSRLLNQHDEVIFSLVITDLTEKKQHDKIVEAERMARLILEQAVEAIIVCDKPGSIIRISQAARQFCNDDPLLKPFNAMLSLQTDESVPFRIDSILAGETMRNVDVALKRDGQLLHLILNAGPLLSGKEILGCVIILTNITARRWVENYREMSREILQILNGPGDLQDVLRHVVSTMKTQTGFDTVGIRLQDDDDSLYLSQQGFPEDFLVTENSLIGQNRDGGVCRDQDGTIYLECTCGLILSGRTNPNNPLFTPGGSFWTNDPLPIWDLPPGEDPRLNLRNKCLNQGYASVALIPIKTTEGIIGLIQLNDRRKECFTLETVAVLESIAARIGEAMIRKQTKHELQEREDQLKMALKAANAGIWEWDLESNQNVWSDELWNLYELDRTADEASYKNWMKSIHPDDRASIESALSATVEQGGEIRIQWRVNRKQKNAPVRWLLSHGEARRNKKGDLESYLGIVIDITDMKQVEAERTSLTEQLQHSQKMESVGRLAGGVAHDFNNMLQIILGYTELALGKTDPFDPLFSSFQEIQGAAQRSSLLTRQLLAFAREQTIAPVTLDLNDEISNMIKMLRRLLREEVVLVWRPGANLHQIKLDPSQIDQILINLCINAQDAISGNGRIIIETENVTLDETYCSGHVEVVPGDYVALTISDTGCGMDTETLGHIFEPFFTTKEVGKGTGLGMATVYGIVKQNGGFIYVYSEPGQGTTFKIHLLQTKDLPRKSDQVGAIPPLPEVNGEIVLLVEDEPSLRTVYNLFLNRLGYTVLTAETPQDALELSAQHPTDIHLLLTDVVMPGMNGKELAEAIRAVKPSIKVLFMSGYTADVIADSGVLELNTAFIAKPFSYSDLARKLNEVLKSR